MNDKQTERWREVLTARIRADLNRMLDHGLITQTRYDAAVKLLEPEDSEPDDWYEHPRAWQPDSQQTEAVDEGDVPF